MQKLPKGLLLGLPALMLASIPAMAEGAYRQSDEAVDRNLARVSSDVLTIGVVFGLAAIYMFIRYTARSPGQVGEPVKLSAAAAWAWVLIPSALFLADDMLLFGKGWTLFNAERVVPANAVEVKVTGHQWYFDFDYGNGVTDQELVVEVGKPVVLRMNSEDVIHSFGLIQYKIKEDLVPGRITYLWFYPDEPKETHVNCMEYCGTGHAQMSTPVRALPKAEFDQWVAKHKSASAGDLKFASQTVDGTASK